MSASYHGLNIAVLGLGASGEAAARLAAREGARVTVFDSSESPALTARVAKLDSVGITCVTGANATTAAAGDTFDLAILSPGIDPAVPLVNAITSRGVPIIGELELAFSLCNSPVVGITGTNGKTTTTELVSEMFNGCGTRTIACGNIGRPFADVVLEGPDIDMITLEVSSFQLETIRTFRPVVSAWLNFSPDHLDRYRSMDEYRNAKLRIFENQTAEDTAVVNQASQLPELRARRIRFSASLPDADFSMASDRSRILHRGEPVFDMRESNFTGTHNAENIMATLAIGHSRGLTFDAMRVPLLAARPSPHRCERVAEIDGVTYVNDSKSTNVDSLEKALLAMPGRVVLIAGGKEKGFDFESLRSVIGDRVRVAVLIGEIRGRLRREWDGTTTLIDASTLAEAVNIARAEAQPGESVLLSPGTSSFDMFKDYADRGNQFRELVLKIESSSS